MDASSVRAASEALEGPTSMATVPAGTISPPRTRVPFRRYAALLWKYLRPQKALAAVVAVSLLGNIGLQLISPQILRYFIDEALAGSQVGRLVWIAVLFTAIALVQQAVNVVAVYTSGRVGWTATNALRGDLARHCMKLDMSFHNRHTPGAMIERIDGDAEELGSFFSTFVIQVLGSTILLARHPGPALPRGVAGRPGPGRLFPCRAVRAVQPAQPNRRPVPGGQGGERPDIRLHRGAALWQGRHTHERRPPVRDAGVPQEDQGLVPQGTWSPR